MPTREEFEKLFDDMTRTFQPERAQGMNTTYLFRLSGEIEGDFWVKVSDGTAEYGEGTVDADVTINSDSDDFYALITGSLNPMQAFMTGKLRVSDPGKAMKLMSVFKLGS